MDIQKAVTHLEAGDWEAAHRIVQDEEGPIAAWAHGIVHMLEGDLDNAGYWYRRAGRRLPERAGIGGEIAALKAAVARPGG